MKVLPTFIIIAALRVNHPKLFGKVTKMQEISQPAIACSKLTVKTEHDVKFVQT